MRWMRRPSAVAACVARAVCAHARSSRGPRTFFVFPLTYGHARTHARTHPRACASSASTRSRMLIIRAAVRPAAGVAGTPSAAPRSFTGLGGADGRSTIGVGSARADALPVCSRAT
jgi:hypothetical protein